MPTYSAYRYGNYSVTVPAYSQNVRFTIAAAGGGGSRSDSGGWNWSNGGNGRAGDFRLVTRTYDYTLTFYIGERGENGVGPANPGGSGGRSGIASGGGGHRSGGGGGGASGVYDGGLNRYTVIVGGGGGAGRYNNETGISGYYSAGRGIGGGSTTGSISGKTGGTAPAGHRGGGGGGSQTGGAGSLGGTTTTNGYAGIGGNSAWYNNSSYYDWTTNSGYGNSGDGYYILSFDYAPPTIQYFTIEPDQIILGQNTVLSWGVTGNVNTVTIDPILSNQPLVHSVTISPTQDTQYNLIVSGPGGTVNSLNSIDVIIPPTVTLISDATDNTIVRGESVNLDWTITGDASTAQMNQGVGDVNISGGPVQVSPTQTTTYTLTASHPLAGQASDEIEITVLQPPTVSLSGPASLDYGTGATLKIDGVNVATSMQLLVKYNYQDAPGESYEIVEEFGPADVIDAEETFVIPYNDFGPESVDYKLYAIGSGGLTDEDNISININIDRTPDALDVPETDDAISNEDPVISPDAEVTSVQLLINDIDIPVKIKADYPIQVEIDNDGVYRDVEQI